MTDTRKASLTLFASTNADGPDGIRMECEFQGDYDPTSNVDNIINYFATQLIDNSAALAVSHLQAVKAQEEKPRIVLAGGA